MTTKALYLQPAKEFLYQKYTGFQNFRSFFRAFKVQFFKHFSQNVPLFTSKTIFQQIILFVLVVSQLHLWLTKEDTGKMLLQEDSFQILPKLEKIVIKLVSSSPPPPPPRFRIFLQTFYPVQEFSLKMIP